MPRASARWVVEVDALGEAGEPRAYTGTDPTGVRTLVDALGTRWQGVGATPAAALDYARRARSAVLPHVDELVRRTELALALVTRGGEEAIARELVSDVGQLLGLSRVPPVLNEWTLRAWLVDLWRALGAP